MIELQQMGISYKQSSQPGGTTPPPCNDHVIAIETSEDRESTQGDSRGNGEPLLVNKFAGLMYLDDD